MTAQAGMPLDFWEQVRKVAAEEVAKYARSGASRNSSVTGGAGLTIGGGGSLFINGGSLRVQYPENMGSGTGVYFGNMYDAANASVYQGTGLLIQDENGTDIATFRSDAVTGNARVILRDAAENTVMSTSDTGVGLARPYLNGGFTRARWTDFGVSTTSAVWETLWSARVIKQHPRLDVAFLATMDTAGTTGQVRIVADGVQIGTTQDIVYAVANRLTGGLVDASPWGSTMIVEVQAQRTSATGALRVEPYNWSGKG